MTTTITSPVPLVQDPVVAEQIKLIRELRPRLLKIPGDLKTARQAKSEAEAEAKRAEKSLKDHDSHIQEQVMGNKELSSEIKRKAGIEAARRDSAAYQSAITDLAEANSKEAQAEVTVEELRDKRRCLESVQSGAIEILQCYRFVDTTINPSPF